MVQRVSSDKEWLETGALKLDADGIPIDIGDLNKRITRTEENSAGSVSAEQAKTYAEQAAAERKAVESAKLAVFSAQLTSSPAAPAGAKTGDLFIDVSDGNIYRV